VGREGFAVRNVPFIASVPRYGGYGLAVVATNVAVALAAAVLVASADGGGVVSVVAVYEGCLANVFK
jgi:hypothetical protein